MTRVDHVLVAVPELPPAMASWTAAGFNPVLGGTHPGGTSNALIRGPEPAYLELIRAGVDGDEAAARVRESRGPFSWALGVDDIDAVRARLQAAGYSPRPVRDGSRVTPQGEVLRWRTCDVTERPLDPVVPFLIQWDTPMPAGAPDGPRLREVVVRTPAPDDTARTLVCCGLSHGTDGSAHPQLTDGTVAVTLLPGTEGVREVRIGAPDRRSGTLTLDGLVVHLQPADG